MKRLLLLAVALLPLAIAQTSPHVALGESTAQVLASQDTFLKGGSRNENEGANPWLRIASAINNRPLVAFNATQLPPGSTVVEARLVLTIGQNTDNWGPGRAVEAVPLLDGWTEGNGKLEGLPQAERTRGTGSGTTWNCASDANISNQAADCGSQWAGGTFGVPTADAVVIMDGMIGEVSWDVTADVRAGVTQWGIRKQIEAQNGRVLFYSREGATALNEPGLGPRLELQVTPPAPDAFAFVTTETGDVAVIELGSGATVRTLETEAVGLSGVAISDDGSVVAALDTKNFGDLFLIDAMTGTTLQRIQVVQCCAIPNTKPMALTLDSENGLAYVSLTGSTQIAVVDTTGSGQVLDRLLGVAEPWGIVVSKAARRLYVTVSTDVRAYELNPNGRPTGDFVELLGLSGLRGLALTPDGTKLLAASRTASYMSIIDASTMVEIERVSIPGVVFWVAASGDSRFAFVAGGNSVWKVDLLSPSDPPLQLTHPQMGNLASIASDGHGTLAASDNSGEAFIIDEASFSVSHVVAVPGGPQAFGQFVWPSN